MKCSEKFIETNDNDIGLVQYLHDKYTYFSDEDTSFTPIDLYITNHTKIDYGLPDGTEVRVFSIKAFRL